MHTNPVCGCVRESISHPCAHDPAVNVVHLQRCNLWEGTNEYLTHKYWCLKLSAVKGRIASYERCDDLTPGEELYLAALRKTVEETPALKVE